MAYSDEVLTDSPLLYWRLGESSGTTAADTSGNGRTGTFSGTGVTYSVAGALAGDANTSITTNGTAGRVQSDATLDLSAFSAITVEAWVKFPSYSTDDKLLMETSASAGANNGAFYLDPNPVSTKFDMLMKGAAGLNSASFVREATGAFHHYVFIFRTATTTGACTVRVDKVDKSMLAIVSNSVSAFGNHTVNLCSRNAASLFLSATVDEVAIYGSALSTARSDAHYDAGAPTNKTVVALPSIINVVAPIPTLSILRDHPYADVTMAMDYA